MSYRKHAGSLQIGRSALLLACATVAGAQTPVSAPEVRIGTSESDPRHQFAVIGDAVTLADGRIAVLDVGARIVRLYGRDGRWQRDLGRAGDGPGEYREPVALSAAGSAVLILDNTGRLLVHHADGRDGRTTAVRPESPDNARFRLQVDQPISATQVLLRANERTFGRVRGDYRATTGLLVWSGGAIDTLAWFPGDSLRTDASGVPVPRPFAPALGVLVSASASHVAVLEPETGKVTVFDVARGRRTAWNVGRDPVVPSAEDLTRLRDDRLRGLGGNDARVVGEWLDGQPGPARPVVALRMLIADDALWLERPRRVDDRPRWMVFSLEGEPRSETTLPAGFELLEVRDRELLGIRRNADDVDILERRRLGATSGGGAHPRPFFPGILSTVNGLAFEPDGRAL